MRHAIGLIIAIGQLAACGASDNGDVGDAATPGSSDVSPSLRGGSDAGASSGGSVTNAGSSGGSVTNGGSSGTASSSSGGSSSGVGGSNSGSGGSGMDEGGAPDATASYDTCTGLGTLADAGSIADGPSFDGGGPFPWPAANKILSEIIQPTFPNAMFVVTRHTVRWATGRPTTLLPSSRP